MPGLTRHTLGTTALAIGATLIAAAAAPAASRTWTTCSKALTTAAAGQAGVPARMDGDARLKSVFGGDYAIAYARLNDAVFTLRGPGRDLIARSPQYAANDPNCCPSQIRERRIHWIGRRFATTVRIRKA